MHSSSTQAVEQQYDEGVLSAASSLAAMRETCSGNTQKQNAAAFTAIIDSAPDSITDQNTNKLKFLRRSAQFLPTRQQRPHQEQREQHESTSAMVVPHSSTDQDSVPASILGAISHCHLNPFTNSTTCGAAAITNSASSLASSSSIFSSNHIATHEPADVHKVVKAIEILYNQRVFAATQAMSRNGQQQLAMFQLSTMDSNVPQQHYQPTDASTARIFPFSNPHITAAAIAVDDGDSRRRDASMNCFRDGRIPTYVPRARASVTFDRQEKPKPSSPGSNHPTTNNIALSKTLKIPTLSINGKELQLRDLLTQQDRALTTRFTFTIIEHFDFVYFDEADRRSHRTHLPVGFRGIGCRHCLVPAGKSGRYFPSSLKTLSDSQKTLYTLHNHLIKCRVTPEDVKYRLDFLRQTHLKERKTLQCYGTNQRLFFRRIWELLLHSGDSVED
jgi:hypothetical protein